MLLKLPCEPLYKSGPFYLLELSKESSTFFHSHQVTVNTSIASPARRGLACSLTLAPHDSGTNNGVLGSVPIVKDQFWEMAD